PLALVLLTLSTHSPPLSPVFLTFSIFFFFTDTAPTEIYTLSLHDALPIFSHWRTHLLFLRGHLTYHHASQLRPRHKLEHPNHSRSEEHTSELQSLTNLVCRLLLEKKKKPPQIMI